MQTHTDSMLKRTRRAGFTLAEMLIALSVTGFLAAGVLSLMSTTLNATDQQNDTRSQVVRQAVLSERLAASFRSAALVLVHDADTLTLWLGDRNHDGEVNLSEVRVLVWDADAGELSQYQAPDALDPADDTGYPTATDFDAALGPLLGSAVLPGGVIAKGISTYDVTLTGGTADRPDLFHLTIRFEGMTDAQGIELAVTPRVSDPG